MLKFYAFLLVVFVTISMTPQHSAFSQVRTIIDPNICTSNGGTCTDSCWTLGGLGASIVGMCNIPGQISYCCAFLDSTAKTIAEANVKSTISDPVLQSKALVAIGARPVGSYEATFVNNEFKYQLLEPLPGQESASPELPSYITALYNVALVLLVIAAVLMISIGGFTWLTSAGNTAQLGVAKKTVAGAIIGLVAALVGWLIFNVISPDLTKIQLSALSPVPSTPATSTATLPAGVTPGVAPAPAADIITAANAVKSNPRITLDGSGECKDPSGAAVSPQSVINEVTSGKAATYCNSLCKAGTPCTLNGVNLSLPLLNAMNTVAAKYPFRVTSITGGKHDPNSRHYKGVAIDIVPADSSANGYINVVQAFINAHAARAFCDKDGVSFNCQRVGEYNHAHVDF